MIPVVLKRSLGVIALGLVFGIPAHGQSLKAAVERTMESNPDILIDASRRLSLDQAVKGARGAYLPRADLALGGGREWSDNATTRALGLPGDRALNRTEASLTLTQMLFDGFAVKSEVERNQARVESAANRLAGTSEQVALQAVEAYLEVLRHRDLVQLTRENSGIHQRTFDQIKIRSDSGVGRRADLDQINARLGLAKANLAAAEANLRDAEINFQRIVGAAPVNLGMPEAPPVAAFPGSGEEAIRMALEGHPVLKSAQADVEAAAAQARSAKSTLYPHFDLQVGATRNRNIDGLEGSSNDQFAMVRMRYNLFNGGIDQARINETAQQSSEARQILERTRRQVAQSTRLSWNAMTSVQERLPALRQHAESSAATRDAYTKQFSIGQRTLLDMLDAENETFTAASNYISGQYLETFARYRVLADLGQLLGALGVAPREEALLTAR
jgi:adhesin transport system outer membrane protein